MRRTLFLIPHELGGLPIAGWGWALIVLGVAFALRMILASRKGSISATLQQEGWLWAAAGVLVTFILPQVEVRNVDGDPIGIAVRGYGFFLLLGVGTAVMAAAYRASKFGLNPDLIFGLAPWTFIGGIVGARLFYVIQYRHEYMADSLTETLRNMLAFTGGGLVVYGGFIGGFAASAYYLMRHRMPLLKLGDAIVPCIFIGLMFGRLGCLMNGCCYGGRCEPGSWAVQFPQASPVFHEQLINGELIGIRIDDDTRQIVAVQPGSLADDAGLEAGQTVDQISLDPSFLEDAPRDVPADQAAVGVALSVDDQIYRFSPQQLPRRSLSVHATQIISSISAAVMVVVLWLLGWWWTRRPGYRDGALMLIGFVGYAIIRFGLEWVRVDEAGQFGTGLSISQWVSIAVLLISLASMVWLYRRGPAVETSPATAGMPQTTPRQS
ncbi:prolipoprotein diacylglyceryl transferase [Crateriforma conspicua]|uniref:Phosphatidylglycerol--prolipoprotein diacylglyceryl transferase n=1 Tax=Crateriforma conspicua TaxID=2527996 RepID=A0A5C6FZ34_9PLAN|nr:prolipoprotein diacylglyceryl transferase family protein [Crateriforma conspicua]TWU66233.1 Prolipoprotein diacylglyceryl transferase [Crateriforma conspicua]